MKKRIKIGDRILEKPHLKYTSGGYPTGRWVCMSESNAYQGVAKNIEDSWWIWAQIFFPYINLGRKWND